MNPKLTFGQSITAGLLAGLAAAVLNAVLFFVFHATGVLTDTVYVQPPNQPLTIMPVIMASLVPALVGSIVFFLLEKFTNNGFRIFSILAVILVVLSLASPFTVPQNGTVGYGVVLCVMHLVVAAALLYFLRKRVQQHPAL
ncbi:MAG: hypothetical protein H7Z21_12590 [Hymenobacter sp.]|nr:hypothetical protein [Hymenobacter sp.]